MYGTSKRLLNYRVSRKIEVGNNIIITKIGRQELEN
jgi:hypothetical protein